jgi:hypothetical protein
MTDRNENDLTLDEFCSQANAWLLGKLGISTLELADWDWWNGWNDGMSPEDAARECLAADDIGCMMLALLDGGE